MSTNKMFEATGGIWLGDFVASAPFGKIELYDREVIFKIQYLPDWLFRLLRKLYVDRETVLPFEKIKSFQIINMWILGHGVRFIRNENQFPYVITVWLRKRKATKLQNLLQGKIPYGGKGRRFMNIE